MAYHVEWYHPNRVILARFWGDTSVEELKEMFESLIARMDVGDAPVHTISDITEMRKFPLSIAAIKNAMPRADHPNQGWNVVVGGPVLAHSFSQIISRVLNVRYRSFQTRDEALEFLAMQDETLEPRRE
jgi:hypothetical protein